MQKQVNVRIDQDLYMKARAEALRQGRSFRVYLEEALTTKLEGGYYTSGSSNIRWEIH